MKKITFIAALTLFFACAGLYAQDLLRDSPDYKKGREFQALARQAYDEGDYEASAEYSASAQEHFQLARDYADLMALRYTAHNLKNRVQDRFRYADSIHAERDYPEEYARATAITRQADDAFTAEDYAASIVGYRTVLDMAKDLSPVAAEPSADLAKADELRATIAMYGLASFRPDDARRGDDAYNRGKGLIGSNNAQAKRELGDAIKYYQSVINDAVTALAAKRKAELAEAKARADEVNASTLAPESYSEAQHKERSAESNLFAGSYDVAWNDSEAALAAYKASYERALAAGNVKPEYYTVRLIPEQRDCLWRIAGYDFIYGDPEKWRLLYNENKHLLPDSNNPRLIEPGTRLRIPSQPGEVRSGEYKPR